MKVVCFSVHCDDAAFSVGAALRRAQATKKIMITLMSRSRFAWGRHSREECTDLRIEEDRAFAAWAGATSHWAGLQDCSLAGAPTDRRRDEIGRALDALLSHYVDEDTAVWLPIGISTHPDHRALGELVLERTESRGRRGEWWLYEDLPYAVRHPKGQGEELLTRKGWSYYSIVLWPTDAEIRSVLLSYPSQRSDEIERDLRAAPQRLHPIRRGLDEPDRLDFGCSRDLFPG